MVALSGASCDLPLDDACLDILWRLALIAKQDVDTSFGAGIPMGVLMTILDAWLQQGTKGERRPSFVHATPLLGLARSTLVMHWPACGVLNKGSCGLSAKHAP